MNHKTQNNQSSQSVISISHLNQSSQSVISISDIITSHIITSHTLEGRGLRGTVGSLNYMMLFTAFHL